MQSRFMQNFEHVLEEIYPGLPQRKRIGKEVENLMNQFAKEEIEMQYLTTPLGVKINITLTYPYIDKQIGSDVLSDILRSKQVNFVIFDILLDKKFPFSAPSILMVSTLGVELEINDGREIFESVMKRKWCSLILLRSIIEEFPKFILEIYQDQKNLEKLKKIGGYHEGAMYNIQDMTHSDSNYVTLCQRIDQNENTLYEYIDQAMGNSVFKVQEVKKLETLQLVKRKQEFCNLVCFMWKRPKKGAYQDDILENDIYLVPNVETMLENLLRVMVHCGAIVDNNTYLQEIKSKRSENPDEYSKQNILASNNPDKIFTRVAELESLIENQLDYDQIQELLTLYRKAIEILSVSEDQNYNIFVMKTQDLLRRDDIQIVLRSKDEVPEIPKKKLAALDDSIFESPADAKNKTPSENKDVKTEVSVFKFVASDEEEKEEELEAEEDLFAIGDLKEDSGDFYEQNFGEEAAKTQQEGQEIENQAGSQPAEMDLLSLEIGPGETEGDQTEKEIEEGEKQAGDEGNGHSESTLNETNNSSKKEGKEEEAVEGAMEEIENKVEDEASKIEDFNLALEKKMSTFSENNNQELLRRNSMSSEEGDSYIIS